MANYYISIDLTPSCCSRNYLESVCNIRAKMFRGRKYEFMWSSVSSTAGLVCNGVLIGIVDKGRLGIFPQFSALGFTKSSLSSLMALFNLYPL